ncbi:hypothetical protein CathTA2_2996 [Caldalkalibacillus thermarum TA2.A1]|uniref:Post-transcriptional regulator n=1 Tax=Caldalkalibacillus thermarum (strain TA2.A1) TaxID=986075 RepID=F5LAR1_CALTT|nr:post-transcriptional regulator [Caldalkalibacillus thermarum]EGL81633.1 hypothetical protein CathTA2_2996 [Caldalkalibacillus thermarum TA2.A1]QZT33482.1 post-transcriptional regulator [Caldalkalibacillus thermarum TA2.A1]GGK16199.1 hypothetical protein GCM10010965_06560 [Caldalkalibacillus thermarum]
MDKASLLKEKLEEVLQSKVDEFHLLGYAGVTKDEIWDCVTSHYKGEWPPLYRLVNDIYTLKATDLMNWLTMGAYRGSIDFGKNSLL